MKNVLFCYMLRFELHSLFWVSNLLLRGEVPSNSLIVPAALINLLLSASSTTIAATRLESFVYTKTNNFTK